MKRSPTGLDRQARQQEQQYSVPYHYLPHWDGQTFRQHHYWSWGFRYLGRLEVTFALLRQIPCGSLVDIGCGDGRFLAEVEREMAIPRLLGVDISARAVDLASRMNPALDIRQLDIQTTKLTDRFEVATLLEVLEHIPPSNLARFLEAVADTLVPGGHLLITVPHRNVRLITKHHQHFDGATLGNLLADRWRILHLQPFDNLSLFLKFLYRMLGGSGKYFIVTHPFLTRLFYTYYRKRCLLGSNESGCERLACLAKKL